MGSDEIESAVSGLRLQSDLRVQVTGDILTVTMENVKEAHYNDIYPRGTWPYSTLDQEPSPDVNTKGKSK